VVQLYRSRTYDENGTLDVFVFVLYIYIYIYKYIYKNVN